LLSCRSRVVVGCLRCCRLSRCRSRPVAAALPVVAPSLWLTKSNRQSPGRARWKGNRTDPDDDTCGDNDDGINCKPPANALAATGARDIFDAAPDPELHNHCDPGSVATTPAPARIARRRQWRFNHADGAVNGNGIAASDDNDSTTDDNDDTTDNIDMTDVDDNTMDDNGDTTDDHGDTTDDNGDTTDDNGDTTDDDDDTTDETDDG
ncbi:hypothetical protein EDB84DRAFT_1491449, partial [Lactarius hengduanensis]